MSINFIINLINSYLLISIYLFIVQIVRTTTPLPSFPDNPIDIQSTPDPIKPTPFPTPARTDAPFSSTSSPAFPTASTTSSPSLFPGSSPAPPHIAISSFPLVRPPAYPTPPPRPPLSAFPQVPNQQVPIQHVPIQQVPIQQISQPGRLITPAKQPKSNVASSGTRSHRKDPKVTGPVFPEDAPADNASALKGVPKASVPKAEIPKANVPQEPLPAPVDPVVTKRNGTWERFSDSGTDSGTDSETEYVPMKRQDSSESLVADRVSIKSTDRIKAGAKQQTNTSGTFWDRFYDGD